MTKEEIQKLVRQTIIDEIRYKGAIYTAIFEELYSKDLGIIELVAKNLKWKLVEDDVAKALYKRIKSVVNDGVYLKVGVKAEHKDPSS